MTRTPRIPELFSAVFQKVPLGNPNRRGICCSRRVTLLGSPARVEASADSHRRERWEYNAVHSSLRHKTGGCLDAAEFAATADVSAIIGSSTNQLPAGSVTTVLNHLAGYEGQTDRLALDSRDELETPLPRVDPAPDR